MSSGAHAQHPSSSPEPVQVAPDATATPGAPPFWLAGVVITAAKRSALLVVLDDMRREVGVITLREGESFGGYSVAAVEPSRVLLNRGGVVFPVIVGRPDTGPKGMPHAGPRVPIFIPGPDKPTPDLEYTGPQVKRDQGNAVSGGASGPPPDPEAVQNFLQRLFSHPQIQQTVEEIRPVMRQRLERARQDGQEAPAVPAEASKPQGTSR
jgi:hypothetical protein